MRGAEGLGVLQEQGLAVFGEHLAEPLVETGGFFLLQAIFLGFAKWVNRHIHAG